jgi:hypothetical protein
MTAFAGSMTRSSPLSARPAGIAVAILVAVNSVGSSLTTLFNTVATDLKPQ